MCGSFKIGSFGIDFMFVILLFGCMCDMLSGNEGMVFVNVVMILIVFGIVVFKVRKGFFVVFKWLCGCEIMYVWM